MNKIGIITVMTFIFCLAFLPQEGAAQENEVIHLTVEDAIRIGLQQNFGILIAENEAEIDRLNRTLGNAGFLPRLNLSGSREHIYETESETRENRSEEHTSEHTSELQSRGHLVC